MCLSAVLGEKCSSWSSAESRIMFKSSAADFVLK